MSKASRTHPEAFPAKRRTSSKVSRIAARGLKNPETLTLDEIQTVCASALAQDETARRLELVKAALEHPTQGT